jgi:hypothetical protein
VETPITPDGKKRMIANQLMARIKLQNKKTCAVHHSIGHSWFQALEQEFQRGYFAKVSLNFIPAILIKICL